MVRNDQPYTDADRKDDTSFTSLFIWAVIWIAVLLAMLPH
jgi:hypothetical protein